MIWQHYSKWSTDFYQSLELDMFLAAPYKKLPEIHPGSYRLAQTLVVNILRELPDPLQYLLLIGLLLGHHVWIYLEQNEILDGKQNMKFPICSLLTRQIPHPSCCFVDVWPNGFCQSSHIITTFCKNKDIRARIPLIWDKSMLNLLCKCFVIFRYKCFFSCVSNCHILILWLVLQVC